MNFEKNARLLKQIEVLNEERGRAIGAEDWPRVEGLLVKQGELIASLETLQTDEYLQLKVAYDKDFAKVAEKSDSMRAALTEINRTRVKLNYAVQHTDNGSPNLNILA